MKRIALFLSLVVVPLTVYAATTFTERVVDDTSSRSYLLFGVDLDGDSDIDIAGIDQTQDDVLWFENDGSQNFTKNTIDSNAPGVRDVQLGDIDNDGDIDFVITQVDSTPDGVYWYENDGSENFTKRTISTAADPIYVELADVNDDNELDVLVTLWTAGDLIYYENQGGTPSTFSTTTIDDNLTSPRDLEVADIDGDNDKDIVAVHQSSSIQFYKNDGSENFTETTIAGNSNLTHLDIDAVDLDEDGDIDLIVGDGSFGVRWFSNDGAANPSFTNSVLDSNNATYFEAADLDADGDLDIACAYQTSSGNASWLENDGSENFTRAVIDSSVSYAWQIDTVDVDGDGVNDIVLGSNNAASWYESSAEVASVSQTTNGAAAARLRREMIARMREGIYEYVDTKAPSLAEVGIFTPHVSVHAAAEAVTPTVQESAEPAVEERVLRARNKLLHAMEFSETPKKKAASQWNYASDQHRRICARVYSRFADNPTMIERINNRLTPRFGWHCPLSEAESW